MKKQTYTSPEIVEMQCSVESGIAVSGDTILWYEQGGQGDFTYEVTNDETWG
ncbi:MAG: hypothetical protein IJZ09_02345 [Tidjanibacter sp.]|nr:hypothetical protein [Tidjanibacter sp.]